MHHYVQLVIERLDESGDKINSGLVPRMSPYIPSRVCATTEQDRKEKDILNKKLSIEDNPKVADIYLVANCKSKRTKTQYESQPFLISLSRIS